MREYYNYKQTMNKEFSLECRRLWSEVLFLNCVLIAIFN